MSEIPSPKYLNRLLGLLLSIFGTIGILIFFVAVYSGTESTEVIIINLLLITPATAFLAYCGSALFLGRFKYMLADNFLLIEDRAFKKKYRLPFDKLGFETCLKDNRPSGFLPTLRNPIRQCNNNDKNLTKLIVYDYSFIISPSDQMLKAIEARAAKKTEKTGKSSTAKGISHLISLMMVVSIMLSFLLVALAYSIPETFFLFLFSSILFLIIFWAFSKNIYAHILKAEPMNNDEELEATQQLKDHALAILPQLLKANNASTFPNAIASGLFPSNSSIIIIDSIEQKMDRKWLGPVVAHELTHIRKLHVLKLVIVTILCFIAMALSRIYLSLEWTIVVGTVLPTLLVPGFQRVLEAQADMGMCSILKKSSDAVKFFQYLSDVIAHAKAHEAEIFNYGKYVQVKDLNFYSPSTKPKKAKRLVNWLLKGHPPMYYRINLVKNEGPDSFLKLSFSQLTYFLKDIID